MKLISVCGSYPAMMSQPLKACLTFVMNASSSGEAGNVLVPVLDCVPLEKVREVLQQVDQIVRSGENIEKALDIVDNGILKEYLGIDEKICSMSRGIWRKMQHRRLKRG